MVGWGWGAGTERVMEASGILGYPPSPGATGKPGAELLGL